MSTTQPRTAHGPTGCRIGRRPERPRRRLANPAAGTGLADMDRPSGFSSSMSSSTDVVRLPRVFEGTRRERGKGPAKSLAGKTLRSVPYCPMPRRHAISRLAAIASLVVLLCWTPRLGAVADTLPDSISDRDFWNLSEQLSEPNGYFVSDNLVSNERTLSTVAQSLARRVKTGGVYLGVGPEQNFTYIAAIQPKMAFITDIRRGNLHMHL